MSKGKIEIIYDEKGIKEIRRVEDSNNYSFKNILWIILIFLALAVLTDLCGMTLF